jgi:hypothetical protein
MPHYLPQITCQRCGQPLPEGIKVREPWTCRHCLRALAIVERALAEPILEQLAERLLSSNPVVRTGCTLIVQAESSRLSRRLSRAVNWLGKIVDAPIRYAWLPPGGLTIRIGEESIRWGLLRSGLAPRGDISACGLRDCQLRNRIGSRS